MYRQMIYYIFSIVILLIFITPSSVYGVTCSYSQTTCYSSYSTWCCPSYQRCGTYYQSCYNSTTPLPSVIWVILTITILFVFCIFIGCIRMCAHSQQQRQARINMNPQIPAYSYQQQPMSGPPRVVPVRPIYNGPPQIHNTYEAPPPSYDVATGNMSVPYPSAPRNFRN